MLGIPSKITWETLKYQASTSFEPFDRMEIGNGETPGSIESLAIISNTSWFEEDVVESMYEMDHCAGWVCIDRDIEEYGYPPERAVWFNAGAPDKVSHSDFNAGGASLAGTWTQKFKYAATEIARADHLNFKQGIATNLYGTYGNQMQEAIDQYAGQNSNHSVCSFCETYGYGSFAGLMNHVVSPNQLRVVCAQNLPAPSGTFPVQFQYRLPGIDQISSIKVVHFTP